MWYSVHMGEWVVTVIAFLAICAAIVGYFLLRAPIGYEDEGGFHYGTPDEPLDQPGAVEERDVEQQADGHDPEQA